MSLVGNEPELPATFHPTRWQTLTRPPRTSTPHHHPPPYCKRKKKEYMTMLLINTSVWDSKYICESQLLSLFFATLWVSEKSVFSRIQACKAMVSRKNWYCSSANSIMSGKWHLKRKCYSGISSFSLRLLAKKPDSSKSRVAGAMRISKFWLLLQNSPEYM